MYKVYFKQAIKILGLNKFVSIIAIIGTALAIMMIMVLVVTDSVKTAGIAPESNRDRTMYVKYVMYKNVTKDIVSNNVQYDIYKTYLSGMKNAEYISAVDASWNNDKFMVKKDDSNQRILTKVRLVDDAYWKIMDFSFVSGRAFSYEEFTSGIHNAVISENLSKQVFGTADPIGKTIEIDFREYKVIGLVKDVSQSFTYAYGDAYIPYTSKNGYESRGYNVLFLVKGKGEAKALDDEFRAAERKYNATDNGRHLSFLGPYDHKKMLLNIYSNQEPDDRAASKRTIFMFIILLLVPAVNLSSFSISRIKKRSEEIAIRKAFGAKKHIILIQVIYENLITSLIGGVIGLVLSYLLVIWLKQWLLGVAGDSSVPVSALVSLPVFFAAFIACFLLNLLSAGLPAYQASKMEIVDSLTQKDM